MVEFESSYVKSQKEPKMKLNRKTSLYFATAVLSVAAIVTPPLAAKADQEWYFFVQNKTKTAITKLSQLTMERTIANNSTPSTHKIALGAANTAKTEEFISLGSEPYWSVTVGKKGIVYSQDGKTQRFPYVAPLHAASRPDDYVRVYRLSGKANSMLIIQKADIFNEKADSCSDGASENEYPYSAVFVLDNKVLAGCAKKK